MMIEILKKIIPSNYKTSVYSIYQYIDQKISKIFVSAGIPATVYYSLLNTKFNREHRAVLAGRNAYRKRLNDIGESSALLRRNIHRIEKGLIMQPRRDVFAESFIAETVTGYERALNAGTLEKNEQKWFTDVLTEYFNVVMDTKIIAEQRCKFTNCRIREVDPEEFIPYSFDALPTTDITFEQLRVLFKKRRSVRWYEDKDVPNDIITKAVDLASLAPSACNRQPYSFYVSSSRKRAVEIAKCAGGTPGWADNIPCIIVIVGDLSAYSHERDRHLIYIDGALAAMQLMLAFEVFGLSTCPINWPDILHAERKMKKLLVLKEFERPVMLLSVGYAQQKGGVPYSQKKSANTLIRRV